MPADWAVESYMPGTTPDIARRGKGQSTGMHGRWSLRKNADNLRGRAAPSSMPLQNWTLAHASLSWPSKVWCKSQVLCGRDGQHGRMEECFLERNAASTPVKAAPVNCEPWSVLKMSGLP
jgi:hypothetical protein